MLVFLLKYSRAKSKYSRSTLKFISSKLKYSFIDIPYCLKNRKILFIVIF